MACTAFIMALIEMRRCVLRQRYHDCLFRKIYDSVFAIVGT